MTLPFRVSSYAQGIYIFGNNRLTARDGYSGVADGYYTPVEQYAGINYTKLVIDNALTQGWISQQEYDETIAFIPAETSTTDTNKL
jgi:hypothetical protein